MGSVGPRLLRKCSQSLKRETRVNGGQVLHDVLMLGHYDLECLLCEAGREVLVTADLTAYPIEDRGVVVLGEQLANRSVTSSQRCRSWPTNIEAIIRRAPTGTSSRPESPHGKSLGTGPQLGEHADRQCGALGTAFVEALVARVDK